MLFCISNAAVKYKIRLNIEIQKMQLKCTAWKYKQHNHCNCTVIFCHSIAPAAYCIYVL